MDKGWLQGCCEICPYGGSVHAWKWLPLGACFVERMLAVLLHGLPLRGQSRPALGRGSGQNRNGHTGAYQQWQWHPTDGTR